VCHFGEVWRSHKAVAEILAQDLARCGIHFVVVTQRRVTVALSANDILTSPLDVENTPAWTLISSDRKAADFSSTPVCDNDLRGAGFCPEHSVYCANSTPVGEGTRSSQAPVPANTSTANTARIITN
jgi:hypothetical protein